MDYRELTGTGIKIPLITLGTWAIGGNHWGQCDEKGAVTAIETAIDNGITAIDTAPVYGDGRAEELVGRAIQEKRDKIFLATKCGIDIYSGKYPLDLSPSYIEIDLTQSLKRLKTDRIDLYQCHWPDPKTPLEETMAALLRFRNEGKIRYIGVSNFSTQETRQAMKYAPLFSAQSHYSLLERNIEKDVLPFCLENGIHVFTYGSLGAGILTGKYPEYTRFPRTDARSFFYRFFHPRYWQKVRTLVDAVEMIAEEKAVKPGIIAMSWLLRQQGVTSVIVGARSSRQVLDNITDLPVALSDSDMDTLDRISSAVYTE